MTGWKAKRFWRDVTVAPTAEGAGTSGHTVWLDSRMLKTPGKRDLILPTRDLANGIAEEWAAQGEDIQPLTMPLTRAANSAIERVAPQRVEVADMLAAYAETDLLCHRATDPTELQAQQAAAWDPLLEWAAAAHGARLHPTEGILAIAQPPESLGRIRTHLRAMDPFHLTALHDLVTLSGSVVLGLAVAEGHLDPDSGWRISRIDEEWQIALWGRDEEAEELAQAKRAQFHQAHRFWTLLRAG
jgi:chaperone required for assembly of F1-ATPase